MKQPNSRANLDKAIQRLADGDRDAYIAIRAVIANAVVGQMLPEGGWRAAYDEQRRGLDVIDDVDEAVSWANALVGRIAGTDAIANAAAMFADDFMEGADDLPLQERERSDGEQDTFDKLFGNGGAN